MIDSSVNSKVAAHNYNTPVQRTDCRKAPDLAVRCRLSCLVVNIYWWTAACRTGLGSQPGFAPQFALVVEDGLPKCRRATRLRVRNYGGAGNPRNRKCCVVSFGLDQIRYRRLEEPEEDRAVALGVPSVYSGCRAIEPCAIGLLRDNAVRRCSPRGYSGPHALAPVNHRRMLWHSSGQLYCDDRRHRSAPAASGTTGGSRHLEDPNEHAFPFHSRA